MIKISKTTDFKTRTFQQCLQFIGALRQFKFFSYYEKVLTDKDWLALGLTAFVEVYKPYEAICRVLDPALTVYMILSGDIAITTKRKKNFTPVILQGNILATLKAGMNFGELGVLYRTRR